MKKEKLIISLLISFSAILLLWYFQYKISVNVPWWDDFHGLILPVFNLFSEQIWLEKIKLFFSLNNEHRVVNDRFFTLLIYLIFGRFELKYLAIFGFINLIILFVILIKSSRKQIINPLFFIPVALILFQAQYFESLQSLMVPFQNFSVILYVILCFYFLIFRKSNDILVPAIFAFLAIFSHGNGILAFVLGAALLILNLRFKALLKWVAFSIVTIAIYFWGYHKPEWSSGISPVQQPLKALGYVFQFLGSYIDIFSDSSTRISQGELKTLIATIFGIFLMVIFLVTFLTKYKPINQKKTWEKLRNSKNDQFLISIIGFIFCTGILIGLTRTGFPMLSRYTINSAILTIAVYLFLITNIYYKKRTFAITIVFTFIALFLSYYNYSETAIFRKQNAIVDGVNWQKNGTWASQYSDSSHVSRLNPLLVSPYQSGKYKFPSSVFDSLDVFTEAPFSYPLNYTIVDGYLQINGLVTKSDMTNPFESEEGVYFLLKNENYKFIFPATTQKNNIKDFIFGRSYFSQNFKTAFPVNVIPSGSYNIFMIINNRGNRKISFTGKTLKTPNLIF
jgi:hypothetical protein